ncbi:MAG: site-specific DNA-methyltransferase [Deltaproteobacteria bacterium]|nr:site-specific DNA-methyltransferase [Deltaproteobacteria bacterium]
MKTKHQIIFEKSSNLKDIPPDSIDLVVTSPPYPMIEMWDGVFSDQNPAIAEAFKNKNGMKAFELMHQVLNPIWNELYRILKKGARACINIGDATRTIDGNFTLYQNHTRIMSHLMKLGFNPLPAILWRKQTNAPNKFMGSGMLPPGAYVTLEHEYILVVRKGEKREFKTIHEKQLRRESAFFWEERNLWYSDVWMDLKGTSQNLFDDSLRKRSAAYPFELAYRLINMFSIKEDVVLDPFLGIGTTMYAAMACGRNSIGIEIDKNFKKPILSKIDWIVNYSNERIRTRIEKHLDFVENFHKTRGGFKYLNKHYRFPVMTTQETDLIFNQLSNVKIQNPANIEVDYSDKPQPEFCRDWAEYLLSKKVNPKSKKRRTQLKLLG